MHKNIAVKLHNISKVYKLYDKPVDRLKESLHPLKKKYHKEFYALKNINLEIKKGEVLGIVGVNGAGKSTLLKIIAGVLTPTSGRITINGKINAILELSSGLKGEMTGRQNIKLNLQINGIEENTEQITQEIINFADIGGHIDQPVKSYSSGMKARLGFGLATSTDPDVLIVDEVLAVGDVLFQRKCYNRIEKLFKDGKTVIFVSHNAQSVIEFCSNAILLYDREIILEDTPKKVTDFYQKLVFSKDKKKVAITVNDKILEKKQKVKKDSIDYIENLVVMPENINKEFCEFNNVLIKTFDDTKVNNLSKERYKLSFTIKFNIDSENIYFGAQFLTLKGFTLSGSNSKELLGKTIDKVSENSILEAEMEFDNFLLPNTYLIKLFVLDEEGNTSIQNNSYIFKVKSMDFTMGGYVTLNQSIKYKVY